MVACKKCDSMNSVDGAYCKKCGASLPEEEIEASRAKLEELVKEGFQIYSEGRTEEARAVAESALLTNPAMAEALSLKGVCHEREGEIAEALECFERVVELNPHSTLDRITINRLRNKLSVPAEAIAPPPNRRLAFAGAIATTALVLALGGVFGTIRANAANKSQPRPTGLVDAGVGTALAPLQQPAQQSAQGDAAVRGEVAGSPPEGNDAGQPSRKPGGSEIKVPSFSGPALPGVTDDGNKPITLDVRGIRDGKSADPSNQASRPGGGLQDPNPTAQGSSTPPAKQEDSGVIEIKVTTGGNKSSGGSEPTGGQGVRALLEAANAKFTLGRYAEAAQAYQSALAAGAKPGSANQRIGDCYKHLGQRDAAIAAYSRAAKAYESDGNARAAEVCRQAVRDLGG